MSIEYASVQSISQIMAVVIKEGIAEIYYPSILDPLQMGLPEIVSLESLTPEARAIVEGLAQKLPITRFQKES